MTKEPYQAPALTEIGTLHELTLQILKSGSAADAFTPVTGQVGSMGLIN